MKATLPLLLGSLFLSLVIDGCSSSTSTSSGPPPPTGPTNFVYTANAGGSPSTVSALVSDPSTGALTSLTLSPFNAGGDAFAVKTDPAGKHLYVANYFSGDISGFSIDASSGGLTPMTPPTFPAEFGVNALPSTLRANFSMPCRSAR